MAARDACAVGRLTGRGDDGPAAVMAALDVIVQTERRVGRRRVTSIAYVGDDIEEVYRCS